MKYTEKTIAPRILPVIDEETQNQLQLFSSEENQVVVHCRYSGSSFVGYMVRIWDSTFLFPKNSSHRCKLVHAENISIAPVWTSVPPFKEFRFTLVFSGLPKDCKVFDLIEDISEPGGFNVKGLVRNQTDVYTIDL